MNNTHVDLLVIGAGASGACVAYEASKRGLKVALLDGGDISCGTSCRSTKLLHGGVRYLELAFKTLDLSQLKLVREALLERGYWLKNAPFLAHRLELVLPTENCLGRLYYKAGLGLYDALSGKENIGNSRLLSKRQLNVALPSLKDGLNGGVAYSDGQFDDSRLNLLLALTAQQAGATIRTHCKVLKLEHKQNGKVCGAISQNSLGQQERWEASAVINTTGIHADSIRQLAEPNIPPRILASRGVHMVLKDNLCPNGMGVIVPTTDDGRVLFILPFFGSTQIGTTDTPCDIELAQQPSKPEQEYLIRHVKRWFPNNVQEPTIKSCWAGGRPLLKPSDNGTSSSRVVREHEIETLPCGLISAMGGKWTTCRQIALDTLKAVEALLEKQLPEERRIPIIGSHHEYKQTQVLLQKHKNELKHCLPKTLIQERQIAHLQSNYGLEALPIMSGYSHEKLKPLSDVIPICHAEIEHAIKNEYAMTPTDVLTRRCRLAMVDWDEANRLLPLVQNCLNDYGDSRSKLNLDLDLKK